MVSIRRPSPLILATVLLMGALSSAGTSDAQESLPPIEREPFDRIMLTADQDSVVLEIFPLESEGVQPPTKPRPTDRLQFRLLTRPESYFQVEFRYLAKIERFPDILLAEARRLSQENQFDEAFRYLTTLQEDMPQLPGLSAAIDGFLLRNAAQLFRQDRLSESIAVLDELRRRNPKHRGLKNALASVITKVFERDFSEQRYAQAHATVSWARERFARQGIGPVVATWLERMREAGQRHLERAGQLIERQDWPAARNECSLAMGAQPDDPAMGRLFDTIVKDYPVVMVGVLAPPPGDQAAPLDWPSRRQQRLLYRSLIEQVGFGTDGGRYVAPFGSVQPSADAITVSIDRKTVKRGGPNAIDLSRWYLQSQASNSTVKTIVLDDPWQLRLTLHFPRLRPERILAVPLARSSTTEWIDRTRPYLLDAKGATVSTNQVRFRLNNDYLFHVRGQPVEIHERVFADAQQLRNALLRGDVDIAESIHPQDADLSRDHAEITVTTYGAPVLHFLIPNLDRDLAGSRLARRGLLYAIDRSRILRDEILSNVDWDGAEILSGPFPRGMSLDDPLAYAADSQISPRQFQPRLGLTLFQLAVEAIRAKARRTTPQDNDQPQPSAQGSHANTGDVAESAEDQTPVTVETLPPLRLAYPARQRARVTAEAIARYWLALGIAVDTVELEAGLVMPRDSDWDFVVAELVMTEPIFDIHQLLGPAGLVPNVSAYLQLALRNVRHSDNWQDARRALYRLHQLAHDELPVLPLWQLPEALAFRRQLAGFQPGSLSLYQDVEQWRLSAQE